jgi:uncharacterized C2H2 Zn-finger protein
VCQICGKIFKRRISFIKNSNAKNFYCSRECKHKGQILRMQGYKNPRWFNREKRKCLYCEKEFLPKSYDYQKGYGKFCSKLCFF